MQTVMLIEDNEDLVYVLQQFVETTGFHACVARDGAEAWERLERGDERPDVILCDLSLPGLDGLSLVRRIRSHRTLSHVWIVAMSGSLGEETSATQAGANHYLLKPFGIRELEAALMSGLRT